MPRESRSKDRGEHKGRKGRAPTPSLRVSKAMQEVEKAAAAAVNDDDEEEVEEQTTDAAAAATEEEAEVEKEEEGEEEASEEEEETSEDEDEEEEETSEEEEDADVHHSRHGRFAVTMKRWVVIDGLDGNGYDLLCERFGRTSLHEQYKVMALREFILTIVSDNPVFLAGSASKLGGEEFLRATFNTKMNLQPGLDEDGGLMFSIDDEKVEKATTPNVTLLGCWLLEANNPSPFAVGLTVGGSAGAVDKSDAEADIVGETPVDVHDKRWTTKTAQPVADRTMGGTLRAYTTVLMPGATSHATKPLNLLPQVEDEFDGITQEHLYDVESLFMHLQQMDVATYDRRSDIAPTIPFGGIHLPVFSTKRDGNEKIRSAQYVHCKSADALRMVLARYLMWKYESKKFDAVTPTHDGADAGSDADEKEEKIKWLQKPRSDKVVEIWKRGEVPPLSTLDGGVRTLTPYETSLINEMDVNFMENTDIYRAMQFYQKDKNNRDRDVFTRTRVSANGLTKKKTYVCSATMANVIAAIDYFKTQVSSVLRQRTVRDPKCFCVAARPIDDPRALGLGEKQVKWFVTLRLQLLYAPKKRIPSASALPTSMYVRRVTEAPAPRDEKKKKKKKEEETKKKRKSRT